MAPRILIADDEAPQMRALCDTLGQHGYITTGVGSAHAALDAMRAAPFDVLLADLRMPGVDGIALVEAARALDKDLACIIMTGDGSIATAVEAMQVGALDYVLKPFKVSAILPIIARSLETRRLRMQNASLEQRLREHAAELANVNQTLELARRQADRNNQAKSDFLSTMSHELRTPLNGILGFAQILASDKLASTPAQKKQFVHHIVTASRHLLSLINDLLDLAKVESGALTLLLEEVALDEVLRECGDLLKPQARARGIALYVAAAHGTRLMADRTRLKQVLINLMSNAIKYNNDLGAIGVDCAPAADGRIRLSVRDTGKGLDDAQLDAMFQPFNRLGQEAGDQEGTGLGLHMCRKLVESMHGVIGVSSVLGAGSTFWIELPGSTDDKACPP